VGVAFWLMASWLGSTYRWLSATGSSFWDRFHFVLPFSFELTTSGFLTGTDLQVQAAATSSPRRELIAEVCG
jgi:hypothetical protein